MTSNRMKLFLAWYCCLACCLFKISSQESIVTVDAIPVENSKELNKTYYNYDAENKKFVIIKTSNKNDDAHDHASIIYSLTINTTNLEIQMKNQTTAEQIHEQLIKVISQNLNINSTELKLTLVEIESKNKQAHFTFQIVNLNNCSSINDIFPGLVKQHDHSRPLSLLDKNFERVDFETTCLDANGTKIIYEPFLYNFYLRDFLLVILIPTCSVLAMVMLAVVLACCLSRTGRKYYRQDEFSDKKQKAYLSKGVPVILYEEMNDDKQMDNQIEDLHLRPLIVHRKSSRDDHVHERTTTTPAPPEYSKPTTSGSAFDSFNNGIVDAPLAQAEMMNEDSCGLLSQYQQKQQKY